MLKVYPSCPCSGPEPVPDWPVHRAIGWAAVPSESLSLHEWRDPEGRGKWEGGEWGLARSPVCPSHIPRALPPPPSAPAPDSHEPLLISGLLLQIRSQPVLQAVLVLNIPDVLDGPELQDVLQVHFQKPTRGGGEVEALKVVPPGEQRLAVFTTESS